MDERKLRLPSSLRRQYWSSTCKREPLCVCVCVGWGWVGGWVEEEKREGGKGDGGSGQPSVAFIVEQKFASLVEAYK